MKCKVTLTYGNNALDGYECVGDLRFSNVGFALSYGFDGDLCKLSYDGKVLTQTRRGKMKTDITFIAGKRTTCFTGDAEQGYNFLLNVETYGVDYLKTDSGINLTVNYKIEDNRIILKLTAEIDKEQK